MTTIACAAPYGHAGLGQHLAQVVEEARSEGTLGCYYSAAIRAHDNAARALEGCPPGWLYQYTPLRFSPGWKGYLGSEMFDRAVASRLEPGGIFHGFNGQALRSFERARRCGYGTLALESATAHVNHVMRQQKKATSQFGIEPGWLNEAQRRKTLREYALADEIYVASLATRDTFLEEGVPARKLKMRRLAPHPRFVPPQRRPDDGIFRVVYVGGLTVLKGVPVLLEAFSRFGDPNAELALVGGWATRSMRLYLGAWVQRDKRIQVAPGDPLPILQRADVCVHPSYTDGFGYAPMEALACGVPVVVTDQTGMKEHVREGVNGYVVPTGSRGAILDRLIHLRRHPLGWARP